MTTSDIAQRNAQLETARLELSVASAARERRNRPRLLILLGVLLVAAACIYAYTQWSARSAAIDALARARAREANVRRLGAEIAVLRAKESSRGLAPDPLVNARLETHASAVGFKITGTVSDTPVSSTGGLSQHKYSVRAASQDPLNLFKFLERAQSEPGLEISRLVIRPQNEGSWSADVDFTRWEKPK